jgi:hypothetical protein
LTADLGEGDHTVSAVQTDPAGNTSPASADTTFTVDTTALAPVITGPTGTVTDPSPDITGTAEPGATVAVTIDGVVVGTTTADSVGDWTYILTADLGEGDHTVSAVQTDPAGNTSPASADTTFTVDTTAPNPAVVSTPADGSTTNDTTPTYTGTAEPNSTVNLIIDGGTPVTVPVDASGNWTYTPTTALADGPHTVEATATDAAGNTGATSPTNTFTVDTVAPDAPVIIGPADRSTTTDTTPDITGTAEPGATVEVTIDGVVVGTTTADSTGNWTYTPTADLGEGDHTVSAVQTDPAGNTSPASADTTFTVDSTALAPVITGPTGPTGDTTPVITGTGEPGATVTVVIDGTTVGTTTVSGDGTWSFQVTTPLSEGVHQVSATQTDTSGNTSPTSPERPLTIDTSAPAAPVIVSPVGTIQAGTPTITGTGEPGATVVVMKGSLELCTATVGADGTWQCVSSSVLSTGLHEITAMQRDAAGNVSASAMRVLTVPAATPTPTPSTPTPSVRSNQSTSAAPTTSGKLAHTGTEVLGLLGMASALIAAGVRLVIGRRRDQDQSA